MVTQPTPSVTDADVTRVIRREFANADVAAAEAIVQEYGRESYERELARVRLAALKLAAGNLDALRRHIGDAKVDFRDVLLAAEYPQAGRMWGRINELSPEKRQAIYNADWKQYEEWLGRP